jgi:hypothetical protein
MIRLPSRLSHLCRWRYLRWGMAAPGLVFALLACTAHPLEEPKPMPEGQNNQYYEVNPKRDADILFLIDDSPSMSDKQDNLRRNFPNFIKRLEGIQGGLPNVHIGVVTSDLGSGPTQLNAQCYPGGKRGVLRTGTNCGLDPNSRFITSLNNETQNNFTGKIADVFSCMAAAGDMGCGFEHQLQAIRVALYDVGSGNEHLNKGFLRDDAYLAIIILTDEDDCSAEQTSDLFTDDTTFAGTTPSFRCAQVGHTCTPPNPIGEFSTPLKQCKPKDMGRLISVNDMIQSIRKLKSNPDQQIVVAAITGIAADPDTALYRYGKPAGSTDIDYLPICEGSGSNGKATASLRIQQFVNAFGANGSLHSICDNDFGPAMDIIGMKLAAKFGNPCVDAPLLDTDTDTAGLQPECVVTDVVPATGGAPAVSNVLPQCKAGGARPCWQVAEDKAACPTFGFKVNVDRGTTLPLPGTQQSIKCRTCGKPDDVRCKIPAM